MYPTIEDIRKIAAKGQYKRVPVCREVYADRYTPVEAMRTLRKASRHCYLLESASQTEVWGRYSFLDSPMKEYRFPITFSSLNCRVISYMLEIPPMHLLASCYYPILLLDDHVA